MLPNHNGGEVEDMDESGQKDVMESHMPDLQNEKISGETPEDTIAGRGIYLSIGYTFFMYILNFFFAYTLQNITRKLVYGNIYL